MIIRFFLALLAAMTISCSKPDVGTEDQPLHEKPQSPQESEKEELAVLFIGNSFTMDSVTHLPGMLKAAGIDNVHMVHMYYGGRIIQEYYTGWKTSADYQKYECKPGQKAWTITKNQNLSEVAKSRQWDIVVIQEHTGKKCAWKWNTSAQENFAGLIKCVKESQEKMPKLYYILSQAYYDMSKIGSSYQSAMTWTDHKGMWDVVASFAKNVMTSQPFDGIISTGAMLENLRGTSLNNELGLTRDGYHMDNGLARYGASCTVFETIFTPLFDVKLDKNSYRYNESGAVAVTDQTAPVALQAARHAISNPYKITAM